MRNIVAVLICLAIIDIVGIAKADKMDQTIESMIGTWNWTDFTVEVAKCESEAGVCGKVVKGPKNVGMEMIRSKLELRGEAFFGKIAHPLTAEIYNTRMQMTDADTWHMDGCTDANVCASGDFKRMK